MSWLHASTHYGLAEVQGRDGGGSRDGIILVVIGVILAILAAPVTAMITGTNTLSATKRAELRGRISTMPVSGSRTRPTFLICGFMPQVRTR